MAKFRPVSKFQSYTHQALCDWAKAVTLALTGNLTFPTPSVSIIDQNTLNDAYQASILAYNVNGNRGSMAQHQTLMDARQAVEDMLTNLQGYVAGIANGNKTIVMSAGMVPNLPSNPLGILPAPANLRSPYSKHTMSGQTRIRFDRVRGAKSYNVYSAATPTDPFVFIGTTSKTLFVNTGAPGRQNYYFVKAVGANGEGVASSTLSFHSAF